MKKILLGVFAMLLAVATVFATQVNKPAANATDPVYHWFDGESYIGEGTVEDMDALCDDVQSIECLGGYVEIVGETRPSQQADATIKKSN